MHYLKIFIHRTYYNIRKQLLNLFNYYSVGIVVSSDSVRSPPI
nr:MAG TPA: hypothetical protein [Caudoviricetes sp.]